MAVRLGDRSQQFVAVAPRVRRPAQHFQITLAKRRGILAGAKPIPPGRKSRRQSVDIAAWYDGDALGKRRRMGKVRASCAVRANDRQTARQGLRQHHPETVFSRRKHKYVRRSVKPDQLSLPYGINMFETSILQRKFTIANRAYVN